MSDSRVWLRQAKSDLLAAKILIKTDSSEIYCQTAAKCQQVVEKSIKAIAEELSNRRIVTLTIGFDHRVDQYITAIIRAPHGLDEKKNVPDYIRQSLRRNRAEINTVMRLAPHRPDNQAQLPRNTEYPFHNAQGVLIAPADTDVFSNLEIASHMKVAGIIYDQARALISIAEREPR